MLVHEATVTKLMTALGEAQDRTDEALRAKYPEDAYEALGAADAILRAALAGEYESSKSPDFA